MSNGNGPNCDVEERDHVGRAGERGRDIGRDGRVERRCGSRRRRDRRPSSPGSRRSRPRARYEAIGCFVVVRPRHRSVAVGSAAHEVAVGHRGRPVGHIEVERVRGLVARMVVHRVPRRRALGFADDEAAVTGGDPSDRDRDGCVERGSGRPQYSTTVVNEVASSIGCAGVMTNSRPSRSMVAAAPSTVTDATSVR